MAEDLRRCPTVVGRIWVRGTTGSGKTTLAENIGHTLDIPTVDLDDLNWLPGWVERPKEEFRALVEDASSGSSWAIAGNYGKARDILEPRAEVVVWLDYSFLTVFGRLVRRTLRRTLRREQCCNGNQERLWIALFSRESILWWCIATHRRRHRDCVAFMAIERLGQVRLRHRSPGDTQRWLDDLQKIGLTS